MKINKTLPQHFYNTIVDINTRKITDEYTYRVTEILNPTKIILLTRRHYENIEIDDIDLVWSMFGTAVHNLIEQRGADTTTILEERLKKRFGKYWITGQFDCYTQHNKELRDIKVTTSYVVMYNTRQFEWTMQQNIYRLLLQDASYKVDKIYIDAIVKDYNKNKSKQIPNYPQTIVTSIPIEILPEQEVINFINTKFSEIEHYNNVCDNDLPICDETDRWVNDIRCKEYCNCNVFCNYYQNNYGDSNE
ncbi:MAG: hypothetical protein QXG00_04875 [Candidatus Woesearchaeota archaeon]